MKGIILAGGTGSRLFPLTGVTNKHLLPVGRYPMIFHPIAKMAEAGIDDIMIITGKEHMDSVVRTLGSGHGYGLEFTYRVQDQAGGIAEALGLAKGFVGRRDKCLVILGDNIFESGIATYIEAFAAMERGAMILLKEVPDPQRYGVAEISGGRIVTIEEKPACPKSSLCVTGIYLYDRAVFEIIETLKPSTRGELEITDVNNAYLSQALLSHRVLEGWWTDAGTFETLALANNLARNQVLARFDKRLPGVDEI